MTISAHDAARELRARLPRGTGLAKIQKLLYYCQGWHLAHYGEPMFEERIEAWKDGPVVASHWADERHDLPAPRPREVSASHADVIEYVVQRYGSETGAQLIERTHTEDPWRSIVGSTGAAGVKPSPTIDHESLRAFFAADAASARNGGRVRQVVVLGPTPPSDLAREQAEALRRGEHLQVI